MTLEELKELANKGIITDVTFAEQFQSDEKLAKMTYKELAENGIISSVGDYASISNDTTENEPEEIPAEDDTIPGITEPDPEVESEDDTTEDTTEPESGETVDPEMVMVDDEEGILVDDGEE